VTTSAFQQYSGNVRIIQYLTFKCSTNTFEINLFSENIELSAEPLTQNLDGVSYSIIFYNTNKIWIFRRNQHRPKYSRFLLYIAVNDTDVVAILLKCRRCHYIVEMWMFSLYCWNEDVVAILLKCERYRYIVEMRTLPLYCWNASVAAILLKCGCCRYIVEMQTLPLYCWNADVRLHFNNIAATSAFQQYNGNVRISTI
jgi:hypothetical protein